MSHRRERDAGGSADADAFYVRYYAGHKGKFGHEFFEFELEQNGRLRYANASRYKASGTSKQDNIIRKQVFVSPSVLAEVRRIVEESEIILEDDKNWPEPSEDDGRQEFELVLGPQKISFALAKIGSLLEVQGCRDPEALRIFYYLVADLKTLVMSLINIHFRVKPV